MRTTSAFITGAATASLIAIGWNIGQAGLAAENLDTASTASSDHTATTDTTQATEATNTATDSTTGTSTTDTSTSTETTTAAAGTDGTFVGDTVQTRFGPMQVQVVISGGAITDVQTLQFPSNDRKSVEINEQAIPILLAEALDIQSADITNISRATYTSQSYKQSLQSALDAAGYTG
ncbi:MAG: hypothetical protein RIS25_287 [Actinomycetota bacterium]|jgi:uncharacterized protein with FMN-binding domain